MKKYDVRIEGNNHLLMNRMSLEVQSAIEKKEKKNHNQGLLPRQIADQKVYYEPSLLEAERTGAVPRPYLPSQNVVAMLRVAGRFVHYDGKRYLSNKTSSLLSGLIILPSPCLL